MKAIELIKSAAKELDAYYLVVGTPDTDHSGTYYPSGPVDALVTAANWALNYIKGDLEPHAYATTEYINSIRNLKAALAPFLK